MATEKAKTFFVMVTDKGPVIGQMPENKKGDKARCFHRVRAHDKDEALAKAISAHESKSKQLRDDPHRCKCDSQENLEGYKKSCEMHEDKKRKREPMDDYGIPSPKKLTAAIIEQRLYALERKVDALSKSLK